MNISTNITINFSKEELDEVLKEYLARKGYKLEQTYYRYGTRTVGYYTNERNESYFNGVSITAERIDRFE